MATTNDQHYSSLFTTGFIQLSQQKKPKLQMAVMNDMQSDEYNYYNQIGTVASTAVTVRNTDTVQNAVTHYRRQLGVAAKAITIWLDRIDSLKMVADPSESYLQAAVQRKGRDIDDVIITAFTAAAATGKAGGDSTVYDTSMTVASGSTGMTIAKIQTAKLNLDTNEVDEEGRYMAMTSRQVNDLLTDTKTTSSDFVAVQNLMAGTIDEFYGFTIIKSQRLAVASSVRSCPYWHKSAMMFAEGKDKLGPETIISRRDDKNNLQQIQLFYQIGATRLEEAAVGIIEAIES